MSARWPLAVALTLATAPPDVASAGDPRAVLDRAKQATGGARWDGVQTTYTRARLKAGGLEGVVETWADVRRGRYARRYTFGPAKGGDGYDGTTAWTQDDSGQVRLEEGANAREGAADEAYRAALAHWFPERWPASIEDGGERREGDRRFDVVRITPRGGRPFELWVDAASGLVDRFSEKDESRVRTTFLSDYRETDGVRVPFRVRETTGDPKYDAVFTVERVSLGERVEEARFSPPPPPPPDFAIAGGATSTRVPFELLNNHVYVDVRLNGRGPFRLLCDTGGGNIVTPAVAKELGLDVQGALEVRGAGEESQDLGLTRIATVEAGGATLRDQLFNVVSFDELSAVEGVPVQGLVGYEIFKRFVVTIDYPGRQLVLYAPGTFPGDAAGVELPFRFDQHVPEVDGALDGIRGTFWLDTGSRGALSVMGAFAERHGLAKRYGARIEAVTGWGIGGAARSLLARANRLTLGDAVAIDAPVVDISLQERGGSVNQYVAGVVGG
ncbi:MAG TPA: aspartyl protease family protein, partial [Anaeromyxobacter sp.]|nr:aspartyl protease family protein [Anaeromyxobacter sp.]